MRSLRFRIFLGCVFVAALLGAWFFWGADWLAEREWQAYVRDERARGVRWSLAEFRPPPVSAEDDVTRLPIFSGKGFDPLLPDPSKLAKRRKNRDGSPQLFDWAKSRANFTGYNIPIDPFEIDDLRAIDEALRLYQPVVDQVCESKATGGNWGDDFWVVKEDFFSLFQFSTVMKTFRLLHSRANVDIALNRPVDARRAIEAQLRLSRGISRAPTLIMALISFSGKSLARESVWHGLEVGAWDNDALRAFAAEFMASNAIGDFVWGMETERAYVTELTEKWIGDPDKAVTATQTFGGGKNKVDEFLMRMRASRRSWWRYNQLWIERAREERMSSVDARAQVLRHVPVVYDPEKLEDADREGRLAMAASAVSGMSSYVHKAVWLHAQEKMAALACALELHFRAKGKYPEALDELIPNYLPHLPVDPATGGQFRYQLNPDGSYLLYSLGLDREDQGGESRDPDSDTMGPDWRWWSPRRGGSQEPNNAASAK